jgi:hypothetical protein
MQALDDHTIREAFRKVHQGTASSLALNAVACDSARSILVSAADTRPGYPSGREEATCGDGAAVLLVSNSETISDVRSFDSQSWPRTCATGVKVIIAALSLVTGENDMTGGGTSSTGWRDCRILRQ